MKLRNNYDEAVLDSINRVQLAIKSAGVYPEDHPVTTEIVRNSYEALVNLLNTKSILTLSVHGGRLLVDDVPIESANNLSSNFALDLTQRAIDSISFYRELSWRDYLIFIKAMMQKPQQSKRADVAATLKKNGVSTIRLNGIKYKKVLGDSDPDVHHHRITSGDSPESSTANSISYFDSDHERMTTQAESGLNEQKKSSGIKYKKALGDSDPDVHHHPTTSGDTRNNANIIHDFDIDQEHMTTQTEDGLNEQKRSDRSSPVNDLGYKESPIPARKGNDIRATAPPPENGKNIKEYINNLLSGRESDEIEALIEDISRKMDDKSGENRKIVAESLQDITAVLDEFDSLKENFQKISATLINWVKKENQVDTYLAVTKSLQNICSSQSPNKLDSYLMDETIGSRLFEFNELTKAALQEALKARKKNGNSLQYNLGALHLVEETVLTHFLAQQYKDCRVVILSSINHIDEDVLKTIPEKYIRRYQVLPFKAESGSLYTATTNPNDWQLLKDIRFISGYPVIPHLAAEYYLLNSIEKFYNLTNNKSANHQAMSNMQQEDWNSDLELVEETQESVSSSDELKDSDAPIIKLANVIIDEAIKRKASDIHIEPYEHELRVRLRIDGTLITVLNPSKSYGNGLVSRIKIVSGLDISERRLPQDGRFKVRKDAKVVDFRVSTFPGIYGEKIVLRLLDNSDLALDINKLGLNEDDLTIVLSAMYKSKGMILVTGPTGSGKTTTIYSMLRGLNDGTLNISTAEDPVEYNLKGINQFQMNTKIGLNFARALRTFLRQDPDIIMVGEIRDFETAEIAFKAALTGHLVLSTLHTNNAPETIIRLLNIGIEPHIITSSINLIVAQRLIRKICKKCKVEVVPTEIQTNIFRSYGFNIDGRQYCRGEGCEECGNTGYKGRIAVYEVMPLGDEVQEAILRGKPAGEIRAKAEEHGFVSLQTQGFNKVTAGITSLNEWMRVLA